MNQFGVTDPCRLIARHFNVPQAFVDACMENNLVAHGVRTPNNHPTHIHHYWSGKTIIDRETVYRVHHALAEVCEDIKTAAKK